MWHILLCLQSNTFCAPHDARQRQGHHTRKDWLQCTVLARPTQGLSRVFMQALVAATVGSDALPAGHSIGSGRAATQDTAEAAKDATVDAKDEAEASGEARVDAAGDTAMAEASDRQIDGAEVPKVLKDAMAEVPKDAMAEISDSMVDGPEVPNDAAVPQEPSSGVAAVEAGTPGNPVGSASPEEDKPGWAS